MRTKKQIEKLDFQIFIVLWCCNHKIGDKETLPNGCIIERTESGYSILLSHCLEYATIKGKISV